MYGYQSSVDPQSTPIDVIDGTDSAETISSLGILNSFFKQFNPIQITVNTTNKVWTGQPTYLCDLFRGAIGPYWGLFFAHNMVAAVHSSGHTVRYTGLKWT
jgi:hypothetical protein